MLGTQRPVAPSQYPVGYHAKLAKFCAPSLSDAHASIQKLTIAGEACGEHASLTIPSLQAWVSETMSFTERGCPKLSENLAGRWHQTTGKSPKPLDCP